MVFKDLTPTEQKVYEFIRDHDFKNYPWITYESAKVLGMKEQDLYKALSELTKKIRDNIWIYYDSGELHIVAD